ncbi:peptidylprolyl isomerase SurA [Psychromonas aquimarina]|uniref:peptidylprolyl isomerase SurA n=1 Tax=Psychromonas aquimarina TaxID=444919 RepID=UPI0004020802|nr:peptidylprolyl isomerase SurA [Psychromonas aquimarina]
MKLIKHILLPLVCASLLTSQVSAESKPLDKIEAVVNQEVILSSDIKRMQAELQKRYQDSGKSLPSGDKLTRQILDKLISDRLQLQIAERIGLRINDAQLQQTLEQIAENEGKTLEQLQDELLKNGQNYSAFVDSIRNELTVNEIRQVQVRRRINISDQEVEQMVKRINEQGAKTTKYHFAHILLKVNKNGSAQELQSVQEQAEQIVGKINRGTDISQLAIEYSQGPKSLEGGDWGWRAVNEIPTAFAGTFADKNPAKGELIGPFQTDLGIHIIKILDKKGSENIMTEEVNARHILIKSNIILSDKKAEQLLAEYRQGIIDGTETFADLAKQHSQDPGSAVKGGELGWADPNMYVPEFRDLALSLPIGQISKPFRTMHGWHILQVMDKRKSDTTEQATKQKAYGIIFKQRFPAEVYAWMNEIRQEAYIKINNPNYIIEAQ